MDPFVEHRPLLFTMAYELLGSATDADDVVQEAWLRWSAAPRDDVVDPRAYAMRIVTRLALNQLRTLARRKETYVGVWLPEPLRTRPDVAEDVLLAEAVSMAMLVVLDSLGPVGTRDLRASRGVRFRPCRDRRDRRQVRGRSAPGVAPGPLARARTTPPAPDVRR